MSNYFNKFSAFILISIFITLFSLTVYSLISSNEIVRNAELIQYILIADFYSNDSALFLKKELLNQVKFTNKNLLKIKKANNTRYELLLGPYQNIKLIKQDFLSLKTYGFDDIDIIFND